MLDWQQCMLTDVSLVLKPPAGPEHVKLQLMPRRLSSSMLTIGQTASVLHPPAPAYRTSSCSGPQQHPCHTCARHHSLASSCPCLQDTKAARETQALQDFYSMLGQDSARAFYGPGHVRAAHELGAIQTLLITDSLFRVNDVARVSAAPGMLCVRPMILPVPVAGQLLTACCRCLTTSCKHDAILSVCPVLWSYCSPHAPPTHPTQFSAAEEQAGCSLQKVFAPCCSYISGLLPTCCRGTSAICRETWRANSPP